MAEKSFWREKKDAKWLNDFFFYYKNYILAFLFILLFGMYAFSSCTDKASYDLEINYISSFYIDENALENAEKQFAEAIDDADGKKGKTVIFNSYVMPSDGSEDAQTLANKNTKMQLDIAEGDGYLYLVDEAYAEFCTNYGIMEDISEYTDGDNPSCFAEVTDNDILSELKIANGEKLYIGIRRLNKNRINDALHIKKHNNAIKLFKHIIK